MKCDLCHNPATYRLIEIQGGKSVERHLCEQHAIEKGVAVKMTPTPLNELLEKLVLKQGGLTQPSAEISCSHCGMTYDEFRRGGMLGCPDCYPAFERALTPLLERAHEGATRHTGKIPSRASVTTTREQLLRQLRSELDSAVASEQYERAASLRDQLRRAESES